MIIDSKQYSGVCSCGGSHEMATRGAIIEPGALKDLPKYMAAYGVSGKCCALYDENTYAATADRHPAVEQEIVLHTHVLHANEQTTAETFAQLRDDIDIIIAIGAGTVHDTARYCAHDRGIRFVACPTAASVDGFCSTVAAMTWYGFKKTFPAVAPDLVVADVEIIKNAPIELAKSGVGDIIAKYTALADWKMSHVVTGEYLCRRIYDLMHDALQTVVDTAAGILTGQDEAFASVTYALIMSGLAMQMMGNSRPASGAEHHFSHLVEMEPAGLTVAYDALHGEKAGVGAVYALREYKRLSKKEQLMVLSYQPLDKEEVRAFFGDTLVDGIMEENQNDCLARVDPAVLAANWQKVREVIAELPEGEAVQRLLRSLQAKCCADDIGVTEADVPTILHYSPMVRNRLTLMRMHRLIAE